MRKTTQQLPPGRHTGTCLDLFAWHLPAMNEKDDTAAASRKAHRHLWYSSCLQEGAQELQGDGCLDSFSWHPPTSNKKDDTATASREAKRSLREMGVSICFLETC
eukprot:1159179-Pelagomonas_calceolata.AAC.6